MGEESEKLKDYEEFLNLAAQNTRVFKTGKDGRLHDLIDDTLIPVSDTVDDDALKKYYVNKIMPSLTSKNPILPSNVPKTITLRQNYEGRVLFLVANSAFSNEYDMFYINPLTGEMESDTIEDYLKNFQKWLNETLSAKITSVDPLPILPTNEEWDTQVQSTRAYPFVLQPFANLMEPEIKSENLTNDEEMADTDGEHLAIPSNSTISESENITTESPFVMNSRKKSNELRQMSTSTEVNLKKSFYMENFRTFILMLRRLSNMVLLKRGLLEEVTYFRYFIKKDNTRTISVNQSFYENESRENIELHHKNIAKQMNYHKYRLRPYDKKNASQSMSTA